MLVGNQLRILEPPFADGNSPAFAGISPAVDVPDTGSKPS